MWCDAVVLLRSTLRFRSYTMRCRPPVLPPQQLLLRQTSPTYSKYTIYVHMARVQRRDLAAPINTKNSLLRVNGVVAAVAVGLTTTTYRALRFRNL